MSVFDPTKGSDRSPNLGGVRVCVLRGGDWGDRVAASIRLLGGEPVVIPLLEVVLSRAEDLRSAVHRWQSGDYDWMVLTSVNAVHAVHGIAGSASQTGRIAAVGPATAAAADAAGLRVDVVPKRDFSTDGLLDTFRTELGETAARILFPVSNLTDQRMQSALEAAGHSVERVTAYETVTLPSSSDLQATLAGPTPTVVLVTSGSAASAFALQVPEPPKQVCVAAIGYPTAEALGRAGLRVDVTADHHTIDGLLDAVAIHLSSHSKPNNAPANTSGDTKESQ